MKLNGTSSSILKYNNEQGGPMILQFYLFSFTTRHRSFRKIWTDRSQVFCPSFLSIRSIWMTRCSQWMISKCLNFFINQNGTPIASKSKVTQRFHVIIKQQRRWSALHNHNIPRIKSWSEYMLESNWTLRLVQDPNTHMEKHKSFTIIWLKCI